MVPNRTVGRLRRLGWSGLLAVAEACFALTIASLAIALLPFRRLSAMLTRFSRERAVAPPGSQRTIAQAVHAVEAAARRMPWRTVCFQKGVALHLMLQRRGVASVLHYGVAQDVEKGLTAHVWVSAYGTMILGGEAADDYACLATFPAGRTGSDPA